MRLSVQPYAVIHFCDPPHGDSWAKTEDPQIISLLRDIFAEDPDISQSAMQQPLVTRMDPIS